MAEHSRSLSSLDSARNSLGDEGAKEIRKGRSMKQSDEKAIAPVIGKRVRLIGDHPWAGESAEVVGFEKLMGSTAMRVKLLRMDAMYGHECYVTNPKQFREERKGVDW